jgi:hypothetical protein
MHEEPILIAATRDEAIILMRLMMEAIQKRMLRMLELMEINVLGRADAAEISELNELTRFSELYEPLAKKIRLLSGFGVVGLRVTTGALDG